MLLHDEIFEQPERLAHVLNVNGSPTTDARNVLNRPDVLHVVIAARGTSDNAARYAKYVWATRLGLPVTLAAPSLHTRYRKSPRFDGAAVVGISQSGESPDLIAVVEQARNQGRPTIAITNELDSPLAVMSDVVVPLHAGPELSVAATKTYTTSLMAIAMIACGDESLHQVPEAVSRTLDLESLIERAVADLGPIDRAVTLGRGYNHSTAFEWALKLQEMAYVFAHAFSPADFAHGPFAVLDQSFPVLAAIPKGPIAADSFATLERAVSERDAAVLALTDADTSGVPSISVPSTPEFTSPMVFITAAQLFTLHMALLRGVDPESPRGLKKVTRTS
jgi:glucosamine--fructose-6-phosphate aminotransferase (isomerizing)